MNTLVEIIAGKLHPYVTAHVSPDGRWAVVVAAVEMRMSHWVEQAALWQVTPEKLLVQFGGDFWSTEAIAWSDDSRQLTASLRVYPGTLPGLSVTVDLDSQTVTLRWPDHQEVLPLASLAARLDHYERSGGS